MTTSDRSFAGSMPAVYDRYLGPLMFEHYAADLAARVAARRPGAVLETAAGTGIATAEIVRHLPRDMPVTATDLNQTMLDVALAKVPAKNVTWRTCDATSLPFASDSFDTVACQFGAMFFPDKLAAYREALRVLKPGGTFVFNVWDSLVSNPFPRAVAEAVADEFASDPPGFLGRTPYGYHDIAAIRESLVAAGFIEIMAEVVTKASRASAARDVAVGFCQGTPLRAEIEARDASRLASVTEIAAAAVAARFGSGAIESTMQAIVFSARA